MYRVLLQKKIETLHEKYDEDAEMIAEYKEDGSSGYHTKLTGKIHSTNLAAEYAATIFFLKHEEYYDRARAVLSKLISLQDVRENSKTFGLWSYYLEQSLDEMIAPDYNWADFVGKNLAYVLKKRGDLLGDKLYADLLQTLVNAARCSIERNVSPDYTNISLMSNVTILCAAELSGDAQMLAEGKRRLKKVLDYNTYCGSFSEYNSSCYTLLAIEEATRMRFLFDDKECRTWASTLEYMGWELLAKHYHPLLKQLAPPQARAYRDLDDGSLSSFVALGTNEKYGALGECEQLGLLWLQIPLCCPDKLLPYFKQRGEREIYEIYYKKNSIRTKDEDTTIILNVNSPDLAAFSFMTDDYAMGAFEKTDLWNQRRTSMVVWGIEKSCFLRIRCIKNDYDYCSGMVYTAQYKNFMLSHLGFATDRGDFHYILDKVKDGRLKADKLCFRFELGGESTEVKLEQDGNTFCYSDGAIQIRIHIYEAVFDGKSMEIRADMESKCIEMICFDSEREIDFHKIGESYAVFTMTVNGEVENVKTDKKDGFAITKSGASDRTLSVKSPLCPVDFDEAIETGETEQ